MNKVTNKDLREKFQVIFDATPSGFNPISNIAIGTEVIIGVTEDSLEKEDDNDREDAVLVSANDEFNTTMWGVVNLNILKGAATKLNGIKTTAEFAKRGVSSLKKYAKTLNEDDSVLDLTFRCVKIVDAANNFVKKLSDDPAVNNPVRYRLNCYAGYDEYSEQRDLVLEDPKKDFNKWNRTQVSKLIRGGLELTEGQLLPDESDKLRTAVFTIV